MKNPVVRIIEAGATAAHSGTRLKIGDWDLLADEHRIVRNGVSRSLQPLSVSILLFLAEHAGTVVSSEDLLVRFWTRRTVGDDAVHRRIADLRKQLGDDAKRPVYIETIPKSGYRLLAKVEELAPAAGTAADPPPTRSIRFARMAAVAAAACVVVVLVMVREDARARAQEEAVAEAELLLVEDRYQAAYTVLAPHVGSSDPRVAGLLNEILLPASVFSAPAGLRVTYRFAEHGEEWRELGITPVQARLLPRGHYKLKIGESLLMDATHPGVTLNSAGVAPRTIELAPDKVPDEMVFIPGGHYRLGAWGFVEALDLGGYLLDRQEVSNREYRDFVDSGGYQNPRYWEPLFADSAGALDWQVVRERFVDRTGRAGPAGWELGDYPAGSADLPVVGLSWYEASAYLAYRGKSLPSVHHWLRAALGPMEWKYPFAPVLVPRSNINAPALLPVHRNTDAEVSGAIDLIGNAGEWTASLHGAARLVVGSSFRDAAWAYNFPSPVDPLSRPDFVGVRGMRRTIASLALTNTQFDLFSDFTASVRSVSDEVFEGMQHRFAYTASTLGAGEGEVVEEMVFDDWIRRKIVLPTGRADDPLPVYVYLPRRHHPPYQAVVFFPPADSWAPGFPAAKIAIEDYQLDFLPRSGRALVWPVFSGSHERYDNFHALTGPERAVLALERNGRIRDEMGRVIDYLAAEAQFDAARVSVLALSHGAMLASFVLATESRIAAAVLLSVGVAPPLPIFANPQNDPNVFWPRVRQPVLILNGRYDPIRPQQFLLAPLLQLLGTPAADKKGVLYDSGHWPLPRYQMMQDVTDWLDRHLGVVPAPQPASSS